jgi:O-acetyl-ADP-ribose deacetylase (regulator of RNase III)/NAD-dependent SIR2 family protein deacetylase
MHTQESTKSRLERVLRYLLDERLLKQNETVEHHCAHHISQDWVLDMDTWSQLEFMRQLLCQRHAMPKLPSDIWDDIDAVITNQNSHNLLTSTALIPTTAVVKASPEAHPVRLSCWKGDITTLTDVTAIVNAANAQLLGCFHPSHRCIDNVIHTAAGPSLRDTCYSIMSKQGHPEPVGSAKVTPGCLLPASYILHTVGPQLDPHGRPSAIHRSQLASCYKSCLDSAESLPALQDGRKVIAFCCISTGLFAFPSEIAVEIAVNTVVKWCQQNPTTTITDIIFDTFLEKDQTLYQQTLSSLKVSTSPSIRPSIALTKPPQPVLKAKTWLNEATHLVISAGAGLSAATGLDYNSTTLFANRFPALHAKGLRRLYDVFGYNKWENQLQKWGYYFLHLNMARTWPLAQCGVYKSLHSLVSRFQGRYFIRTSNADGFFARNGFDPARVATPQGQYRYLQCLSKCRADAVFEAGPLVDAALPFIDPVTQCLVDEGFVPECGFCGGEVTLCVRGGDYFNDRPFGEMERKWEGFVEEVVKRGAGEDEDSQSARVVILELGVGLNTPGVLRWPNEDFVQKYGDLGVNLIRAGVGASGCVDWDLEEENLAVGISGDLSVVINALV